MHTDGMMQNTLHIPTIRKALKLTQADLAAQAGVNIATVWRWENEGIPEKGPARAFLERLASDVEKLPAPSKEGAAA